MKHSLTVFLAGLAMTASMASAETRGMNGRDEVIVTVTCDDLTAEARARHSACLPPVQPSLRVDFPVIQPPALRVSVQEEHATRRFVRMPWQIGVFQ